MKPNYELVKSNDSGSREPAKNIAMASTQSNFTMLLVKFIKLTMRLAIIGFAFRFEE